MCLSDTSLTPGVLHVMYFNATHKAVSVVNQTGIQVSLLRNDSRMQNLMSIICEICDAPQGKFAMVLLEQQSAASVLRWDVSLMQIRQKC